MSNKEVVIEIIRKMPDEVTFDEILEEIQLLAALRRGEAAAEEGRVVPHEEVRKELTSWLSK
jgi:predicted transcriptional regulator